MADDLPYFKFFPADWLSDERLRICSRSARGTWQDMLCLMWKAKRRGFLENSDGLPLTPAQLARVVGCSAREIGRDLRELGGAGVYSVEDGSGIIFSRRIVRDVAFRRACSEAGTKGGGNPALKGGEAKPIEEPLKVEPKDEIKPQSSEFRVQNNNPPTPLSGGAVRRRAVKPGALLPQEQAPELRERLLAVGAIQGRRESTQWSAKEFEAFKAAALDRLPIEEFAAQAESVMGYYQAPVGLLREHWGCADQPAADFRRRELVTLLNNWGAEVDRASRFAEWLRKKRESDDAGRL